MLKAFLWGEILYCHQRYDQVRVRNERGHLWNCFESLQLDRFLETNTRRSCFHRNAERKGRYCIYTISKKKTSPIRYHACLQQKTQTTLPKIYSTAFSTKKNNLFDGGWIWTFLAANLYTKHQSQQKGPHPQALSQRRRAIEPRATAMSASFFPGENRESWKRLGRIRWAVGSKKMTLKKNDTFLMFGVLEHLMFGDLHQLGCFSYQRYQISK